MTTPIRKRGSFFAPFFHILQKLFEQFSKRSFGKMCGKRLTTSTYMDLRV